MNILIPGKLCPYCKHLDMFACVSDTSIKHLIAYCKQEAQLCGRCNAFESILSVNANKNLRIEEEIDNANT